MTLQEATDTKRKILRTAAELFAKSGFDGTSIRDIATTAEVNVAAINYHFSNKQTLYWQVYIEGKRQMVEQVEHIAQKNPSLEELSVEVFDVLFQLGDQLTNTFRMMLSQSGPSGEAQVEEGDEFGPPGGKFFAAAIERELGDVDPLALMWGVKSIFTHIIHWALMSNTTYCQEYQKKNQMSFMLQPEAIKNGIRHQARAVLLYLKEAKPQIEAPN